MPLSNSSVHRTDVMCVWCVVCCACWVVCSEIVEMFPALREGVLTKLIERFGDIETADVYRVALWILAEYSDEGHALQAALACIKDCTGPLPLAAPMAKGADAAEEAAADECTLQEGGLTWVAWQSGDYALQRASWCGDVT